MTSRITTHFSSKNFSAWFALRQPKPSFIYIFKVFNRHSLQLHANTKISPVLSKSKFLSSLSILQYHISFLKFRLYCIHSPASLSNSQRTCRMFSYCLRYTWGRCGELAFNSLSQKRRLKWSKLPGKRFYRLELNSGTQRALHWVQAGMGQLRVLSGEEGDGHMGQLPSEVWGDSGKYPQWGLAPFQCLPFVQP